MIKGIENRKEECRSGWGRENERPRKEWKEKKQQRIAFMPSKRQRGSSLFQKSSRYNGEKNPEEREIVDQTSIEGANLSIYPSHLFTRVVYQLSRKQFQITSTNIIVILQV